MIKKDNVEELNMCLWENRIENFFYEIYMLIPERFSDVNITEMNFSVRTEKRLLTNSITTVEKLLHTSPSQLMNIRGFGRGCLNEVGSCLLNIDDKTNQITGNNKETIPKKIKENKELIYAGNFTAIYNMLECSFEVEMLKQFEDAYYTIGDRMVEEIVAKSDGGKKFAYYIFALQKDLKRISEISRLFKANNISQRKNLKAYPFIDAFTADESKRRQLKSIYENENTLLGDYKLDALDENDQIFNDFLRWCNFDIHNEMLEFIENLRENSERNFEVIKLRGGGKTLQEIGNSIGVTRERIRQIEKRVMKQFSHWNSRKKVLRKICALRDNDSVLTTAELNEYFYPYTDMFVLMLKSIENNYYYYDKELDVFIIGDINMEDQCVQYIDKLPETFKDELLSEIMENGVALGINKEYLLKAIHVEYDHSFNRYHRIRLSLTTIYKEILLKYYKEGLHIYDPKEINKFRDIVKEEYGDVRLPENDRAISARLADVGILCNRGCYRAKQKNYIPKQLENEIKDYIKSSDESIFPINTLFNMFGDKLKLHEIDNKYYMQGVLRELMSNDLTFRRDYIIKGNTDISFYNEIINLIKSSSYPVEKADIQNKYPGITDIVIGLATSDRNILNFFGKYVHSSKLKLSKEDKEYLRGVIELFLEKGVVNSRDIYSYIERDNMSIMTNVGIYNQYSLYSVLVYLFDDYYQFERPYITKYGQDFEYPAEQLREKIMASDTMPINEIVEFARAHHLQLMRIIDYLNDLNQTHLIINHDTIAKIEMLAIDETQIKYMEDEIFIEVQKTMPISNLKCIHHFPKLNVEWDEWLVYSIINKWSTKLEVALSDSQFRYAIPLISKKGEMDIIEMDRAIPTGTVGKIDNLDDIDELIQDIIFEEMDGSF